jgi:hypothetical protein
MRVTTIAISVLVLLLLAGGCASRRYETIRVPPRIDLKSHELIGVIQFDTETKGELGPLVTARFTELARRDQGMVRIVTFASSEEALSSVGRASWDAETFRAIGHKHGVETLVIGELTVSEVRPNLSISPTLRSGSLSAKVNAALAVEMIETATGASIWNSSARATGTVGQISLFDGDHVVFDAEDPERAYGSLVDVLVAQITRDFQATWTRREVASPR